MNRGHDEETLSGAVYLALHGEASALGRAAKQLEGVCVRDCVRWGECLQNIQEALPQHRSFTLLHLVCVLFTEENGVYQLRDAVDAAIAALELEAALEKKGDPAPG